MAGRIVHKKATDPPMSVTMTPTKSLEKRRNTLAVLVAVQQGIINRILNREHVSNHANDLEAFNDIINIGDPYMVLTKAQADRSNFTGAAESNVAIYDTSPLTSSPTIQGLTAARDIALDSTWMHDCTPTMPARRTASESSEETVQTCPSRSSRKIHPFAKNPY
jgi:hypothetical protein